MQNREIQEILANAIKVLENEPKATLEINVAHVVLTTLKERSQSGNDIPGLRGLGLEHAIELAQDINEHGVKNLQIDTQKLAQGITVEERSKRRSSVVRQPYNPVYFVSNGNTAEATS